MIDVRRADLHTHTHYSDGCLSPRALVAKAHACGLWAVAITDHDCVDGLAEGRHAGTLYGIEVVAGVELSVTVGQERIHLLGYFFDPENQVLLDHLASFKVIRHERILGIRKRLGLLGMPVEMDMNASQTLARPHVADAMVAAGYVTSVREAFDLYLGDGMPAYVAKPPFPASEALALLHAAGGIGVLAHPGHFMASETINALVTAGLDGLEAIHPAHDEMLTAYYRQLARDMGMVVTGGSDFHKPAPDEAIGRVSVPYGWVSAARERAGRHKVAEA